MTQQTPPLTIVGVNITLPGDKNNEVRTVSVARVRSSNTEFIFKTTTHSEGDYVEVEGHIYRVNKIEETQYGRFANALSLSFIPNPPSIHAEVHSASLEAIQDSLNLKGDITLGTSDFGGQATLESDQLFYHTFICGKTGAGKSVTAFKLMTELYAREEITVLVIDPHNEYTEIMKANGIPCQYVQDNTNYMEYFTTKYLQETGKTYLKARKDAEFKDVPEYEALNAWITNACDIIRDRRNNGARPRWLVHNVSGMDVAQKRQTTANLIEALFNWRKQGIIGKFVVFVDESQWFAPQGEKAESKRTMMMLAAEGRKFEMGAVFITQRPARLEKSIISQCNVAFIHKLTNPHDINQAASNVPGMARGTREMLPYLETGECFMTLPKIHAPIRVKIDKVNGVE
jgi:hypothetical protein